MKNYIREYVKLLAFLKGHVGLLLAAIFCMGLSTIFEGVSLSMFVPITDRIFTNNKIIPPLKLPAFLDSIVNKLNNTAPMVLLKGVVITAIILIFVKLIVLFFQNYLMNKLSQYVINDIRIRLYEKFQQLSMDFYSRRRTGELISRITNDVNVIINAISYGLTDTIYESMQAIVFAFVAFTLGFSISWKLALLSFFIFPLIMIPVVRIGKKIKKLSASVQEKVADLNSLLAETIQGISVVKIFCRQEYEISRFKTISQQYRKFTLKTLKRTIVIAPITEFIGVIGAMSIVFVAGKEVIEGRLSFGMFGLFLATLLSMIRPIKKISNAHAINQQAFAASARIYEILNEEPSIKEKKGALPMAGFEKSIVFDHVNFRYTPDGPECLKDINLEIKKGQVFALVGHSGAGKTSLVNLIPRLYDPEKGSILIDGVNIKDVMLKSLRGLIAVVSQDTILFHGTIRDNIAYGREGASEEQIREAARKAYALNFIEKLPGKFDTVVGDRGVRLSGGEKQRISIARAFLKDAPILILDEATSNLDSESEGLIKEALYTLMQSKTVFVIAHRLSTIQKADKILVMDKGVIIEEGTHKDLLGKETVYKKLYDIQFSA